MNDLLEEKVNADLQQLKREPHYIDSIIDVLPEQIYLMDRQERIVDCNDQQAKVFGFSSKEVLIGKDIYDVAKLLGWDPSIPDKIHANNLYVMDGNSSVIEEEIVGTDNEKHFFLVHKRPLYNDNREIIGIVGISIDVTEQKRAKLLAIENEAQKIQIEEHAKFAQIANQLSHDIRSPLAATKIWYEAIRHKLTEGERIMGRNALERATDILNSGFVHYKSAAGEQEKRADKKKPVMLFLALEQIVAEKRLEYQQQTIALTMTCEDAAMFSFVTVKPSALKRMVSNMINNAMDALDGVPDGQGQVTVHLNADNHIITLRVEDNGNGMPDAVKEKILSQISVTDGKNHGNGIGFTQIWDTLKDSDGRLSIDSTIGVGTCISVIFPRCSEPSWVIERFVFSKDDTLVVVDDDPSIHDAWDTRFQKMVSMLRVVHFQQGEKAVAFLRQFPNKDKLLLLTDYELWGQSLNGLDIIEKTSIERAILVTSHADDEIICERALALDTKILPKQLVANISIDIQQTEGAVTTYLPTEVVVMDDDRMILDSLVPFLFAKRNVETYTRPQDCFVKLAHYSKETVFFMDHHYGANLITGLDVAKKLHEYGFHRLYLLTGNQSITVPDYLHVILKTDTERLKAVVDVCFQKKQIVAPVKKETLSLLTLSPQIEEKNTKTPDNELIGILLRHLSHDVLNSLSIIQINADLLKMMEEAKDKTSGETKRAMIERIDNIRQSRKECTQLLRMEIAKLKVAYSVQDTMKKQRYAIKNTITAALSEYVFRKKERSLLQYNDTLSFDYDGNEEMVKQMIFHVIQQGLQVIKEIPKGKIQLRCTLGKGKFNQLMITYAEEEGVEDLSHALNVDEDSSETLDTKLRWIFCRSVMTLLGGEIEHRRVKKGHAVILHFPSTVP